MRHVVLITLVVATKGGCAGLSPWKGGGQTQAPGPRRVSPADIALTRGYRIEVVTTGLNMPSDVTIDDQNRPIVVESGLQLRRGRSAPRLVRVVSTGELNVIASGDEKLAPWNWAQFHDGAFTSPRAANLGEAESRALIPAAR